MNVLLTSAGRRGYLVSYFREALAGKGKVLAVDADSNAAALQVADEAFIAPRFDDEQYLDFLIEVCQSYKVRLLIPLNDLELPLLARARDTLRQIGVIPVVPGPEVVDYCLDKWKTFRLLSEAGIDTPQTFNSLHDAKRALEAGKIRFPVIVKPRWGTGSLGVELVHSDEELQWAYNLLSRKLQNTILAHISRQDAEHAVLVQEFVSGSEYGLDIVNDLDGNYACTLVKKKLNMRAGETDKAVTVHVPPLEELGRRLGTLSKHVAIMDCDVIVPKDGRMCVLELNPRFGGGYPFSHVAGANIPAAVLAWAEGREPQPDWLKLRPGVTAAKYDILALVRAE